MKQIQPIQIWKNGTLVTATHLSLSINYDNLQDTAVFLYRLCRYIADDIETISEGNQSIMGEDYESWGTTQDANEEAYTIIAGKLNIQII